MCPALSSVESNDSHGQSWTKAKDWTTLNSPAKALFAKFRKKTTAKDRFSFNHRQYHHLNKGNIALQEDPSVVSMKSYSSHVHLLPPHMAAARADLPNIVLGTFAAATMPVKQQKSHMIMSPKQPTSSIVESSSPPNNDQGKKLAAPLSAMLIVVTTLQMILQKAKKSSLKLQPPGTLPNKQAEKPLFIFHLLIRYTARASVPIHAVI